ncbi:carboxypeptidase-like regulatory domain-containing protein, partial [Longispora fulva]|uniref:carboxypeptidase-like regulatory domain-containing protein n=1 Tax=Longispora fulva TaxID=619741 RepID=UPI00362DC6DC
MKIHFSLLLFLTFSFLQAQEKVVLNGTIPDATNNETLNGVNILFPDLGTGTVTNEYGFYSIKIPT